MSPIQAQFLNIPFPGLLSGYKSVFKSKTFWGVIVSAAAKVALGVDLPTEINAQVVDAILLLVGLAGDLLALWGRLRAEKKVTIGDPLAAALRDAGADVQSKEFRSNAE